MALVLGAVALLSGCLESDVRFLADDARGGRAPGTAGSVAAQDFILGYLEQWTDGPVAGATGRDAYRQPTPTGGVNLLGVLPGTDLAHEYVLIGAHYDGLGSECRGFGTEDTICNGATDNATGVAAVLQVLRSFAFTEPPRRSVVFAFWDEEEDGLVGSTHYVANPVIPLAATVATVNLDGPGTTILPSLASTTFAVGDETGGAVLDAAVGAAAEPSPLELVDLTSAFGYGRSDHFPFANAKVPSVYLTNPIGPCYHSVDDEVEVVDFEKLRHEAGTAHRLVLDLANRDDKPSRITTPSGFAEWGDAIVIQRLLHRASADIELLPEAQRDDFLAHVATVDKMVADGWIVFTFGSGKSKLTTTATQALALLLLVPCQSFAPATP